MKLSLDEVLNLKSVIQNELYKNRNQFRQGAYKVVNSSVQNPTNSIVVDETELEEFLEAEKLFNENIIDLLEVEKILRKINNESSVTFNFLAEEYTLDITSSIAFVKSKRQFIGDYLRLGNARKNTIEYTGNPNERQVREVLYDIDYYKDLHEQMDKELTAISREIQKVSKDTTVEVPFAEKYL